MIRIPSKTWMAFVKPSYEGCGTGIRIYVEDLFGTYHINKCAITIIHELSHKILGTNDKLIDGSPIYGAKACKALAASDPDQAVTIADNWAMFYMSFGCYPGQDEYEYQAEYEIKDPQQANNSRLEKERQKNNIFEPSNTCVTFEDLEILDARNELL